MSDLFKPDEFAKINGTTIHEDHCLYVNNKLNALIESWPVVYGVKTDLSLFTFSNPNGQKNTALGHKDTHKARLAFIEEIKNESCKHEPKLIGVYNNFDDLKKPFNAYNHNCKHCGVELKATWSEK